MCDRSHLAQEARRKELRSLRQSVLDELDAIRAGKPVDEQAVSATTGRVKKLADEMP